MYSNIKSGDRILTDEGYEFLIIDTEFAHGLVCMNNYYSSQEDFPTIDMILEMFNDENYQIIRNGEVIGEKHINTEYKILN